ncbi:MAG: phosphoribosylamine--glycine ligase [Deltaproteobacteria bacterium]|nr:phosphoribosylamine--glycine ligase [Deltaproteobacteria bacterium]
MKILLVGSGGREHALAWKMAQSDMVRELIAAPGNLGIAGEPKCRVMRVSSDDVQGLLELAKIEKPDLTVVGPEAPLVSGLTDLFVKNGLRVFGPSSAAAVLEGSKVFSKELMRKFSIPSADFEIFSDAERAMKFVDSKRFPLVVKADGLAAGKGVFVCDRREDAQGALDLIMKQKVFGAAGARVIIEDCLEGEEASFIAFTDGVTVMPLASSQDHKAIFDNDKGPNTGGMGAYSPAPVVTSSAHKKIMDEVMLPTVKAMSTEGRPYIGFLYAGLMIKDDVPKVLEFNVRLGDPEAQPLLVRMQTDPIPLMLASLEGKLCRESIKWENDASVCVVMASQGYPGAYPKGKIITGIEDAEKLRGIKVFIAGADSSSDGVVTAGGRVLGVTSLGKDIPEAIQKAYEGVGRITWEGAQFRTDIGRKALTKS